MNNSPDAGEPVPEEGPVARALDALQRPAARPRLLHLLPPLPAAEPRAPVLQLGQGRLVALVVHWLVAHYELLREAEVHMITGRPICSWTELG